MRREGLCQPSLMEAYGYIYLITLRSFSMMLLKGEISLNLIIYAVFGHLDAL